MYHNMFFFTDGKSSASEFLPKVVSAYKILTDDGYYHICDEEEKSHYAIDTLCFIRCVSGSGVIYLKNKSIEIKANDYITLRFSDIVKYKSTARIFAYRWINFTLKDKCDITINKIQSVRVSEAEEKIFDTLMLIGTNIDNLSYVNSLFSDYYFSITLADETTKISQNKIYSNKQTRDICAFVEQKIFNKLSVSELSAFFGISPRRLHQIFIKEVGVSPKQYIMKKKMEEGYRLLVQTSMPINKIAEALCFSSQYHFTNEFKKLFHQTPTEVRNMEK